MGNKKYKIGVIGNRDTILPYHLIGFNTFPVSHAQDATNTLRQLAQDEYGIIYVTEDIATEIPDTIAYYDHKIIPALILIPSHKGSTGLGLQRVQDNGEKAVGQKIL